MTDLYANGNCEDCGTNLMHDAHGYYVNGAFFSDHGKMLCNDCERKRRLEAFICEACGCILGAPGSAPSVR